jgi:hypothetical protein
MTRTGTLALAPALAALLLAAGCASEPAAPANLVARGHIAATHEAAARPRAAPAGKPLPGLSGALGGALGSTIAGMLFDPAVEPAHTVHVISLDDGSQRWVRSTEVFAVGECVDILAPAARHAEISWNLGEASLRKSSQCSGGFTVSAQAQPQ